jgi:hypothetical protein
MLEKQNIIQEGRTPAATEKTADIYEELAGLFKTDEEVEACEIKKKEQTS